MSAPMNIQEAQAARQKLEQEIARLVLEFSRQTGVAVVSIDLWSVTAVGGSVGNYGVRVGARL